MGKKLSRIPPGQLGKKNAKVVFLKANWRIDVARINISFEGDGNYLSNWFSGSSSYFLKCFK